MRAVQRGRRRLGCRRPRSSAPRGRRRFVDAPVGERVEQDDGCRASASARSLLDQTTRSQSPATPRATSSAASRVAGRRWWRGAATCGRRRDRARRRTRSAALQRGDDLAHRLRAHVLGLRQPAGGGAVPRATIRRSAASWEIVQPSEGRASARRRARSRFRAKASSTAASSTSTAGALHVPRPHRSRSTGYLNMFTCRLGARSAGSG